MGTASTPTLETIARRLNVSKVTVSLAMRGSRRISEKMRERVATVAAQVGYTPNPMVSALMVNLRSQRRGGRKFNLCFLTAFPDRDGWQRFHPTFPRMHAGARERAAELGYGIEIHWTGDAGGSGARLTQILESRGIPGIILAPLPARGGVTLGLDWSRFATVALGHTFTEVPCNRVSNHQFHSVTTALEVCYRRGFRRIGLVIPPLSDAKVEHAWQAGYLTFQVNHRAMRRLPPMMSGEFTETAVVAWAARSRPEVVVTTHTHVLPWLRRAGHRVPEDIACVHLDWTPERSEFAGIDQQPEQIGAAAVDQLVEQINQNRRGIPDSPRTLLTEGIWRDGSTLTPEGLAEAVPDRTRVSV
ncbi:LacI family transcriptional regulator [Opitutaceae bacterium TAV5]|nr:LacI family transcriptional regulator [Opitutaceae bacterium TAV5]